MTEQAEYQYDVFISYSHADRKRVWNELLPRSERLRCHRMGEVE